MAKDPNRVNKLYPIQGLEWRKFDSQNLKEQGILVSVLKTKSASGRSGLKSSQHMMSMQQLVDYIITQAVISGDKWGIQDEGTPENSLLGNLNFQGDGVQVNEDAGNDRLNIIIPADMTKAVYDPDDDGSVLNADAILGILIAGNNQYYGTDGAGNPGFHPNSNAISGHNIRSQQYDGGTGTSLDTPYDQRTVLDFGPEFNVNDTDIFTDRTLVLDTSYATSLDAAIMSVEVGGIPAGTAVGVLRAKTYYDLFNDIIFPVVAPVYIEPVSTLTISPGDAMVVNYIKTGLPIVLTFTSDYTQNDGGATTFYRLQENGNNIDSSAGGINHVFMYNFQKFLPGLTYSEQFDYVTEFDFNEGVQLPDSHGNPDGDPPGPGTVFSATVIVETLYPYYYGVSASPTPTPAEIALATEVILPNGENLQIPVVSAIDEYFFIATSLASPNLYLYWHLNDGNSGETGGTNFIGYTTQVINDPDGNFVSAPYSIYATSYPNEIDGILTLSTTDEYTTP